VDDENYVLMILSLRGRTNARTSKAKEDTMETSITETVKISVDASFMDTSMLGSTSM
jgi:hypothetical protein